MSKLQSRTVSATIWTISQYAGSQALRLGGNLIMTRLLLPDAFGMMALIAILMQGLAMFSDVGIGPNIIRHKQGNKPEFLNTAWTIQVVRGGALWICTGIIAIPIASFYNEPQLAKLIPVAGLTALFAGFNSTALITENRSLRLKRIAALEVFGQAVGLGIMIVWALISASVWALVFGGLAAGLLRTILSHLVFAGPKNRFYWDKDVAREMVRFGKWIFLSSGFTFIAMTIDRFVVGKLVSLELLGIYHIGWIWAQLPSRIIERWSSIVFFPLVAEAIRESDQNAINTVLQYRRRTLLVGMAIIAGIVIGIPHMISVFYLPIYHGAGAIAAIIAIGVWINTLAMMYNSILIANGSPQYNTFGTASTSIIFLALVFPLFEIWGVNGIAAAGAISQLGIFISAYYGARRNNYSSLGTDIGFTIILALFAIALDQITRLADSSFQLPVVNMFISFGIAGIACAGSMWYFIAAAKKEKTATGT